MSIEAGQKVTGTVTGIAPFGAFVDLGDQQSGLVHISEVAPGFVKDINDYLAVGDNVEVKVLNVEDGKIALSIRQLQKDSPQEGSNNQNEATKKSFTPRRPQRSKAPSFGRKQRPNDDFDALMSNFLKESEDRLSSLRRNTEGKRGGRGGRRK